MNSFYDAIMYDKLVKTLKPGWLSKKLQIRGAQIFNHVDVQQVLRHD